MKETVEPFGRPGADEYHEYYGRYIGQVPGGDVLELLERQMSETAALLLAVPAARETHRYAADKWTIREVVGHVLDSERVFGLRALHIARGDPAALPSFDQEEWARASNAGRRPLTDLTNELVAVRRSHVLLFRGMAPEAATRRGVASGREFTVRSLAWIIAGHERHHVRTLIERYGVDGESAASQPGRHHSPSESGRVLK